MKTYYHHCEEEKNIRSHPWDCAESNTKHKYYDFTSYPDLISNVLEDFCPWANKNAIIEFYEILRWLNGTNSHFETNDSAFQGPRNNTDSNFIKSLQCNGRLMILYRDIILNVSKEHVRWLNDAIQFYLRRIDQEFRWGVIGTTIVPVRYINLPVDEQIGKQIMLSFWAWGDDEIETFQNLKRTFLNLRNALQYVSKEIAKSISENKNISKKVSLVSPIFP